jgi:hypothetical protein
MPTTLNDPKVKHFLEELRALLALAESAFTGKSGYHFNPDLLKLLDVVEDLQPYLGKNGGHRQVPFWKSVVAVDRARTKLGVAATLDAMVDRALAIQPGPLAKLSRVRLTDDEEQFVKELTAHLENGSTGVPKASPRYQRLFDQFGSGQYRKLTTMFPSSTRNRETDDLVAYTGYLDLCDQYHTWMTVHWPALEPLFDLLVQLDNQTYFDKFEKLVRGDMPDVELLIEGHKSFQEAVRQSRHRSGDEPRKVCSSVTKAHLAAKKAKRAKAVKPGKVTKPAKAP